MARLYVASSWRNNRYPEIVARLRREGHQVYDFRHPAPGDDGFSWKQVEGAPTTDPRQGWAAKDVVRVLAQPRARAGFASDMNALRSCDACVLVLPCGRSAHLELGWAAGAGKRTVVLLADPDEPDLMHLAADRLCVTLDEVVAALAEPMSRVEAPKVLGQAWAVLDEADTIAGDTYPLFFSSREVAAEQAASWERVARVQFVEAHSPAMPS